MDSYLILIVAFAGLGALLWLKRANDGQWSFDQLREIVVMLVHEAEQTMPGVVGEDKLAWVIERCEEIGVTKWIPAPVLSAIIESAVLRLKRGVGDGGVEYDGKPTT